ncbi:alpha/beta hydrolase family protein [Herbaspirillum sp. CF444]|uniref:alpha/beta hydrolase family protein n=1 Tax=Herbaspirillum sp. CF444 TaxID=1144319 RepID=UPI00068A480C|nr:hypothetical protein [Herbaspirillum sp. CF444]
MLLLSLAATIVGCDVWAQEPQGGNNIPFSESDLISGTSTNKEACERQEHAVWVEHRLGTECIRYYPSGGLEENATGSGKAKVAVFYFHGDHLAGYDPLGNYGKITPQRLLDNMAGYYRKFKVPYILIGRPGVYGSSGKHTQRRRLKESYTLNAAVDAIKARYGLEKLVLAGQSGGAYTTAALLTLGRTDVMCAAASSGVYAVNELAEIKRAKNNLRSKPGCDVTNYCDAYEVIDHVDGVAPDPQRVFYLIGNPNDRNTVFYLQKRFADKLAAAGHRVEIIEAKGLGPDGHSLSHVSYPVAGMCAAGLDPKEMLAEMAAREAVKQAAEQAVKSTAPVNSAE